MKLNRFGLLALVLLALAVLLPPVSAGIELGEPASPPQECDHWTHACEGWMPWWLCELIRTMAQHYDYVCLGMEI